MMVAPGSNPPQAPEWAVLEAGSSTDAVLQNRLLATEAETAAFAGKLAAIVQAGDVIALRGDLGSGKTALARAFIRAFGRPDEEVPSPTFTLVQVYEPPEPTAPPIWHFDLFRVASPEDAFELGIEDAFASAVTLIEWPERLGALLPARRLELVLAPGNEPDSRRLCIRGDEAWRARLRRAELV
jgi:tRNA threonylcarbamoyladenosine biosynthesis protein TsaE